MGLRVLHDLRHSVEYAQSAGGNLLAGLIEGDHLGQNQRCSGQVVQNTVYAELLVERFGGVAETSTDVVTPLLSGQRLNLETRTSRQRGRDRVRAGGNRNPGACE